MVFINTKNDSCPLPSRYSDTPKNDRLEDAILTIVENRQRVSPKDIIDKIHQESPKPDHKTIRDRLRKMCQSGKLCTLHDKTSKKRVIGYITVDYEMDEITHSQLIENLAKIRKMLENIESESDRYTYQLALEVNDILQNIISQTPDLIKSRRNSIELQLISWGPDINEIVHDTREVAGLLEDEQTDSEPDKSEVTHSTNEYLEEFMLKNQDQLSKIIYEISIILNELNTQRVEYAKQLQSASSVTKKKKTREMISKVDIIFYYHYSCLLEIKNKVKSKKFDSIYDGLVKSYLQNEPNILNKIYDMLDKYDLELRFKIEDIIQKITDALYLSVDEQNTLHAQFEKEQDKDKLDMISEKLDTEENKERDCKALLDKICQGMQSDMTIKQILGDIPKKYTDQSGNDNIKQL